MQPARHLLIILAAATLLLAACGGDDNSSDNLPAPQSLLDDAATQIEEAESFEMEIDVEGAPVILEVEDYPLPEDLPLQFRYARGHFVAPDKLRASVQVNLGDVGTEVDLLAIGREQFMRSDLLTQSQWIQQEVIVGFSPQLLLDQDVGLTYALNAIQNLMMVGRRNVDGLDIFELSGTIEAADVYSLTFGLIGTRTGEIQIQLYIRANNHRIDQVILHEPVPANAPEADPTIWNIRLMNYNETVEFPEVPDLQGQ